MNQSKYSNVQDVAKFFDVSESTVRLWVKKGIIDRSCYVKADTTYRFDIPSIEKHLRGGNNNSNTSITEESTDDYQHSFEIADSSMEEMLDEDI